MSARYYIAAALLLFAVVQQSARGQSTILRTPRLDAGQPTSILPSNSISQVQVNGGNVWIGTGKGLARTGNGGRSWASYAADPAFAKPGIFAISSLRNAIWTSTGYTKEVNGSDVQTGSGYSYSLDSGKTWTGLPQALDTQADSIVQYGRNKVIFLPIVVPEQNVTFDMAVSDSGVWIASWSSGLRRTKDLGKTWIRTVLPSSNKKSIAPTDSLGYYNIDPRDDNNWLLFSVAVDNNDTIWAGSAGGINKSTDGGVSWVRFSTLNQTQPILSDWVIAIGVQHVGSRTRVWSTNWPAEGPTQQYGISMSEDGGASWKNFLYDVKAYSFAFKDSIVYVSTDDGLYRTDDAGQSWTRSGSIVDPVNGQRITTSRFFAAGVLADTLFAGTADGFVRTIDNVSHPFGQTWEVRRAYQPLAGAAGAYAYPNPFSPKSEYTRIHYSTGGSDATVTIEIFDFGMNRVRTLISGAQRSGSSEHDDLWNGETDGGSRVTNGVYFYRVTVSGADPVWGKIMVLQ
jgi:hypothetical protein